MKKLFNDKRGVDFLTGTIMFILLNVIFFVIIFFFVIRAGSGVETQEDIYAKQIALLIDSMKADASLEYDLSELYSISEKNNYKGIPVEIDTQNNQVLVRLIAGKGASFNYFTTIKEAKIENKKLIITV